VILNGLYFQTRLYLRKYKCVLVGGLCWTVQLCVGWRTLLDVLLHCQVMNSAVRSQFLHRTRNHFVAIAC